MGEELPPARPPETVATVPSSKRKCKTILDYYGKEKPLSHHAYPKFLRRYNPTEIPRGSTRSNSRKTTDVACTSNQNSSRTPFHHGKEKRGSYKTYSLNHKLKIVQYARKNSEYAASVHYKVARSTIYGWKNIDQTPAAIAKTQQKYPSTKKGKHIKTGAGRPLTYPKEIDESVIAWVLRQRDLHLPVRRLELKLKARALICPTLPNFKASSGWVEKFMHRHSLSLRLECHTMVIRSMLQN